ncbi:MAG TPA: Maf family protein [Planctomycetota bacterium]|nr:Maf family protein [Planctomycetota bacterium]
MLASASPRRRELLQAAGIELTCLPVDVDEDLRAFEVPEEAAVQLALRKARAGRARWRARAVMTAADPTLVLGADTIVAVARGSSWSLLGKPVDERDALGMLELLSGTRHMVATGVAVVRASDGAERSAVQRTFVTMREIAPAERASYVESGEWRDKAGGYAIQETADRFVLRLEEGGFDNVVGLPVALALGLCAELGAASPP